MGFGATGMMTNGTSTAQIDQIRRYGKDFQRLLDRRPVSLWIILNFWKSFPMRGLLASPHYWNRAFSAPESRQMTRLTIPHPPSPQRGGLRSSMPSYIPLYHRWR